jgi:hypothetical protein
MALIFDPRLTPDAHRLRDLISDISERCYYAGWMTDTEFHVWRLSTTGGTWGVSSAEELRDQLAELMRLATQLDRWIVRTESEKSNNEAVSLAEWKWRYDDWKSIRPPESQ